MKAIVIATALSRETATGHEPRSTPMLPLVDRPFLQHVVESLVDSGVTEFDFVLSHLPETVERLLGDGSRWGSKFRFHLVRDEDRPYAALRAMALSLTDETIVLAHADRLPSIGSVPERMRDLVAICSREEAGSGDDASSHWTGWALVHGAFLSTIPIEATEGDFADLLVSATRGVILESPVLLSARTYRELLVSQRATLEKRHPGLMLTGRESDAGIWIGRNVGLHPTARIVPPVFIGENCRIGANAQIGPNAVIGESCVLDKGCVVTNAAVLKGSFVGEALELSDVVVDRNRLVHVRLGVEISITDDFLLSAMAEEHVAPLIRSALSRTAGAVLLVLAAPVLILTALILALRRNGPVVVRTTALRLPASHDPSHWRTFELPSFASWSGSAGSDGAWSHLLLRVLPGLVRVVSGDIRLVGVAPRPIESVEALPDDWRALYEDSKAGLVTEASVFCGPDADDDDVYAAEAFYSVQHGLRQDARLLAGFVGRLLVPRETSRLRGPSIFGFR